MANASKIKGNGYERDLCKYFKGLSGLEFLRVPSSGAYIGRGNITRADNMDDTQKRIMDGDIIVPEEWKNWSIEAKFYKSFAWKKLFSQKGESQLNTWISQAETTTKLYWILCFKINNAGQYCVVDKSTVSKFKFKLDDSYMIYGGKYIIMDLKRFFDENHLRITNA